ncbi:MAG: DUF481 domain-containing protein [Gemmatimonadota bacterium]
MPSAQPSSVHRTHPGGTRACAALLAALFSLLAASPAWAQKTDVVTLRNGDEITGEIKEMALGILRFSTDAAGTINIEWPEVTGLRSVRLLEMELSSGLRVLGSLEPTEDGRLAIVQTVGRLEIPLRSLVTIAAIGSGFWSRIDGLIAFGFDFAKANDSRTLNGDFDVHYRAPAFDITLDVDTYVQSQAEIETTTRATVGLRGIWNFSDRWGLAGLSRLEQNDEIDLDLRATVSSGISWRMVQTNHVRWLSLAGLGVNRERFTGEETVTTSSEIVTGTAFNWFIFGDHQTTLSSTIAVFPNLSDVGRVRLDADSRFKRELILDFFIALSGFTKFDSRPPGGLGEPSSSNDYGFSISLGFDF